MYCELFPQRYSSVCLVGHEQGSVDGFHAGRAGEGPHEPVINTFLVVGVHTRKIPQQVAHHKLTHTYNTPAQMKQRK